MPPLRLAVASAAASHSIPRCARSTSLCPIPCLVPSPITCAPQLSVVPRSLPPRGGADAAIPHEKVVAAATLVLSSRYQTSGVARSCQVQVAAAMSCHHLWPPVGRNRPFHTRPKGEGSKTHVAGVCFKCFRCFICMLQVFHIYVTKLDRDVAYVAMVVHACCKRLF